MACASEIEIKYSLKEMTKRDSVRICPLATRKAIYRLPLTTVPQGPESAFRVYEYGTCLEGVKRDEKIILVVGATGAGKTTFINSLINFVFGVEFEDDFRFKMVTHETEEQNQAQSQTRFVNAYTLHYQEGFTIPYTLTIIDTPGFGDSRGMSIQKDYEIAEQLYDFFKSDIDIVDHIDVIGFVCPASLPRLTPTQKYIFDTILALFGNDIEENIYILLTFGDASPPMTLAAIEEAKVPHKKYFKFNSSGIFMDEESDEKPAVLAGASGQSAKGGSGDGGCGSESDSEDSDYDEEDFKVFWTLGMKNFKKFTKEFKRIPTKSLKLTKEVLEERRMIEIYIRVMKQQVRVGLLKLQQLKKEEALFKAHGNDSSAKLKEIRYEVDTVEDEDSSKASKGSFLLAIWRGLTAFAEWFKNIFKKTIDTKEPVIKTVSTNLAETKTRYEEAEGRPMSGQDIIDAIKQEYQDIQLQIVFAVNEIQKGLNRLREIALKVSPISSVEYIDILIQNERSSCRKGWKENVEELERIRAHSIDLAKIYSNDFDPYEEFSEMMKNANIPGIGKMNKSPNKEDLQRAKRAFLEKVRLEKGNPCSIQ